MTPCTVQRARRGVQGMTQSGPAADSAALSLKCDLPLACATTCRPHKKPPVRRTLTLHLQHVWKTAKTMPSVLCAHNFALLKSDSTLVQWACQLCYSGPHWWIFECRYCKLHTCRTCTHGTKRAGR